VFGKGESGRKIQGGTQMTILISALTTLIFDPKEIAAHLGYVASNFRFKNVILEKVKIP
jgi:hypothetical protein